MCPIHYLGETTNQDTTMACEACRLDGVINIISRGAMPSHHLYHRCNQDNYPIIMKPDTELTLSLGRYNLISVERAEPRPAWLPEGNWHRYVLEHNDSDLVGYHIGTLATVTAYAEKVAADLNERNATKRISTALYWGKGTNNTPS